MSNAPGDVREDVSTILWNDVVRARAAAEMVPESERAMAVLRAEAQAFHDYFIGQRAIQ